MCKQILLPVSVKSEMVKMFKTNRKALERALKFQVNSPSARTLRTAALQRGGLIYNDAAYYKGFVPECDTTFDHAAGTMTQSLPNGITLEIRKSDNSAVVRQGDRELGRFEEMTIPAWGKLLFGLQMVYNNLNS